MLGEPPADSRARSLSTDDQQTSKRLRRTRGAPSSPAGPDEDEEDELDEDDSDAELLAQVKKLNTRPPPTPARPSRRQNLKRVEDSESDELSEEEAMPSPGTRAQAERKRRSQHAKVTPNAPPQGTRPAKGKGKAHETAPRRKS
jgi:hypothetical protein